MANVDVCFAQIESIKDRPLTADKKKRLHDLVKDLDASELEAVLGDYAESASIIKRNFYYDSNAKLKMKSYIEKVWKDDPAGGLQAYLEGSDVKREGAADSLTAHVAATRAEMKGALISELEQANLSEIAKSPEFNKQVRNAMWELSFEKPNQKALQSFPDEVVEIAKILHKYSDATRVRANKAGAWIAKLEGRTTKNSHDELKIRKAAGSSIAAGDPAHAKKWIDDVMELIDWEKTFKGLPKKERSQALQYLYTQLSSGYHVKSSMNASDGRAFLQKRMSGRRVIHFKDFEAEWKYNQAYGNDAGVVHDVLGEIDFGSRNIALMERLGPSFTDNINEVVNDLAKSYVKNGDGANAAKLAEMKKKLDRTSLPEVTGENDIVENINLAQAGSFTRKFLATVDLGGAAFAQLGDLATLDFVATRAGVGRGAFGNVVEGLQSIFGNKLFSKPTKAMQELAQELSIALDSTFPDLSKYDVDAARPGKTSKLYMGAMKVSGLPKINQNLRFGAAKMIGYRYGAQVGKAFGDLPVAIRENMSRFGIKDWEWDIIRNQELFESDGVKYLTPRALDNIAPDSLKGKVPDNQIPTALKSIKDKYRNMVVDYSYFAEPTAKARGEMLQGTKRGSIPGEATRSFWAYKTTVHSIFKRVFGGILHGQSADRLTTGEALKRLITHKEYGKARVQLARSAAVYATMGYAALTLKDVARGRTPRVPETKEQAYRLFLDSMAQSGFLGIYGDFLAGELVARYGSSGLDRMLGPVYGRAADATSLLSGLVNGETKGQDALKFLYNNMPGKNLLYTRWLLDYAIVNELRELGSPGANKRMIKRLKEEKGQELFYNPR